MTSANVDFVRSIYAIWEREDWTSAEWADPNIEYVIADGPSPGSWTGAAALGIGIRDWFTAFEGFSIRPEEFRALDDERVLVLTRIGGRGKRSGIELEEISSGGAHVFTVRSGSVTRLVRYFDRERAFADLGLTLQ
jgi:ketosteroid isomerase-like protein